MELSESERKESESYLSAYERLMGDERTRKTVNGIVYGIIGAESLRASQIALFPLGWRRRTTASDGCGGWRVRRARSGVNWMRITSRKCCEKRK